MTRSLGPLQNSTKFHPKTGFRRILAPFASSRGHVDRIKWLQRPSGNYERTLAPSFKEERILLGDSSLGPVQNSTKFHPEKLVSD